MMNRCAAVISHFHNVQVVLNLELEANVHVVKPFVRLDVHRGPQLHLLQTSDSVVSILLRDR